MEPVFMTKKAPARLSLPSLAAFPWETLDLTNQAEIPACDEVKALTAVESCELLPNGHNSALRVALGGTSALETLGTRERDKGHMKACSLSVAYRLLDIRNRMAGKATAKRVEAATPRILKGKPDELFKSVLARLTKWPEMLSAVQEIVDGQRAYDAAGTEAEQNLLDFAIKLDAGAKYGAICMNFSFALIHLRMLMTGCTSDGIPDIPDEKEAFIAKLKELYGANASVPSSITPHKVRIPLLIATLISPVALFIPKRLDNGQFKRLDMLALFMKLGSYRPPLLKSLEELIWTTLFEVATNPQSTNKAITSAMRHIVDSDVFRQALTVGPNDPNYYIFQSPQQSDGPAVVDTASQIRPHVDHTLLRIQAPQLPGSNGPITEESDVTMKDIGLEDSRKGGPPSEGPLAPKDELPVHASNDCADGAMEVDDDTDPAPPVDIRRDVDNDEIMDQNEGSSFNASPRKSAEDTQAMPIIERKSSPSPSTSSSSSSSASLSSSHPKPAELVLGVLDHVVDHTHGPGGMDEDVELRKAPIPMGRLRRPRSSSSSEESEDHMEEDEDARLQGPANASSKKAGSTRDAKAAPPARWTKPRGKRTQRKAVAAHHRPEKKVGNNPKAAAEDREGEPQAIRDQGARKEEEEDTELYEEIAEGIWVSVRRRNLDAEERPKVVPNIDILAYGASKESCKTFQASCHDQEILQNIELLAKAVKDSYVDDLPLHCHPTKKDQSVFHLISQDEFDQLSDRAVQDIFRQRHIVVFGQRRRKMQFGEALRTLGGGLERTTEIQDQSLPSDENVNNIVRVGSLHDILAHASSPTGNALNALDFPMPQASMAPNPFASDAHARLRTADRPKWDESKESPTGHFRWGLAATSGAFHTFHIDSNGFGTFITPITGSKWWIVARPIRDLAFSAFEDVSLLAANDFSVNGNGEGLFTLEAILLGPDMELYMRPNTVHAVYTPESSVVHGGHFFSTSTLRDTLAATFHTTVLNDLMTNTDHPPAHASLRRMIDLFHCAFIQGAVDGDDPAAAHIPDLTKFDGLLDLISICSIGRLLSAVDKRTYGDEKMIPIDHRNWLDSDQTGLPLVDRLANQYARAQCDDLLRWLDAQYEIVSSAQDTPDQVLSVAEFQHDIFQHHIQLLQYYKHLADQKQFVHSDNFTAEHLDVQLAALCEKYSVVGWNATEPLAHTVEEGKYQLYAFPRAMKLVPKEIQLTKLARPHLNIAFDVKRLLKDGMTSRDVVHETFRTVKLEQTNVSSKKRKF